MAQTSVNVPTAFGTVFSAVTYRLSDNSTRSTPIALFNLNVPGHGSSLAGFCVELGQTIRPVTNQFWVTPQTNLASRGTGGTAAASFGIGSGATGGIGAARASRLERLFRQQYRPSFSDPFWTQTVTFTNIPDEDGDPGSISIASANLIAFQLAVWELSNDGNGSFGGPATSFFRILASDNNNWNPGGGAANGRAIRAVLSLAQAWATDAFNNPISTPTYTVALINDQFVNPAQSPNNIQDLIIPEPSTYAAIAGGLALLGAFLWRRRTAGARG